MTQKDPQLLVYNNSIYFSFKNFTKQYDVEISIDGDMDTDLNIISYKALVSYTKDMLKPYFLAEVTITDFLLNFKYADTTMQLIALKCREAIEKCVFQVNTKNEIIDLDNYKEIVEKWEIVKQKVRQEFEGDMVDKYLTLFEKNLRNKAFLLQKIKKNLFINQYFFPIFDEPYHGFQKKGMEIFSFFNLDYQEEVILEIENQGNFDENGKVIISKQLVKSEDNVELFPIKAYTTKYILNKELHIDEIEGEFINQNKKYSYSIR